MAEKLTWSFDVKVAGGPSLATSATLEVDAYDKIVASLTAGGNVTVDVQPGDAAKFLLVTSSHYDDITYKVDGGGAVTLDGAHILVGVGAVSLLGNTQNQFVFTHGDSGGSDATITIFVGRDATS